MNDRKFFDKMARKYIKRLKLKNDPEEKFYDILEDFINSWRERHKSCRAMIEDIKDNMICYSCCRTCKYWLGDKYE